MNGMHQEQRWAYNFDSDDYTPTWQFELPPTNTLVQVSLGDFYEFDDKSHVDLGLISGSFLDTNGVTRPLNFPDIDSFDAVHVLAQPGLTSIVYGTKVSNAAMSAVANFFFWDQVS